MKNLTLIYLLVFLGIPASSQTLRSPSVVVASGTTITISGSGESPSGYFSHISIRQGEISSSSPDAFGNTYVRIIPQQTTYYNVASAEPSKIVLQVSNDSNKEYTMIVPVDVQIANMNGLPSTSKTITLTIKVGRKGSQGGAPGPPAGVFYNKAISRTFYKNDCPTGYSSNHSVIHTIREGAFQAESQEIADRHAEQVLYQEGQRKANTGGGCTLIYVKLQQFGAQYGSPRLDGSAILRFYSDASGTTPLRVNSLEVNTEYTERVTGNPPTPYIPKVTVRPRKVLSTGTEQSFVFSHTFFPSGHGIVNYKLTQGNYIIIQ